MIKTSILRYSAIGIASLALAGVAAASTASISGTTGPHSHNKAISVTSSHNSVSNHNNVGVGNINAQGSATGDAKAEDNTTVGNVGSGDASNDNTTKTTVSITNGSGAGMGAGVSGDNSATLDATTGPHSDNVVVAKTSTSNSVHNSNNVGVLNLNFQGAWSGDARAEDNTTVGNVTSGDASNTNDTTTTVTINN